MRGYLTTEDEKNIFNILNSNKKRHQKIFDVEDYCVKNEIIYDRVKARIDSMRFLIAS